MEETVEIRLVVFPSPNQAGNAKTRYLSCSRNQGRTRQENWKVRDLGGEMWDLVGEVWDLGGEMWNFEGKSGINREKYGI